MGFHVMERPYARDRGVACVKLPYFAFGALPCCLPALRPRRAETLPRVERRRSWLLCVWGAASLLAAGTATAAQPVLPLGTDGHGVHLQYGMRTRHGLHQLVLTFDDSASELFQRIAGRRLALNCTNFDRDPGVLKLDTHGSTVQRAPRRRKPMVLGYAGRFDVCGIGIPHGRFRTTLLARIPLTALGAKRLDERDTAMVVIAAARTLARPERPSAAAVAATFHGVALAAPTDTPPTGVLGVYSDGAEHAYAAQIDRSGKLLFVELEHDVTRSNITDYLAGNDPLGLDL